MNEFIATRLQKLELHYYFSDQSHSINALLRNKCEAEFLAVAIEVADQLGIELELDSEALKEGGLREIWKAAGKNGTQLALVISVLALVWSIVPKTDSELIELQKEDLQLSIEERKLNLKRLKRDIGNSEFDEESVETAVDLISDNLKVATRKSNFYKTLIKYQKVTKIGLSGLDANNNIVLEEREVPRKNFRNFILLTDKLPAETIGDATIEIVSPILNNSKAKWKGIYNDEYISFSMNDSAYRQSVIGKEKTFKNGDCIVCELIIDKKLNELGDIVVSGYTVDIVLEDIESGVATKTRQGKVFKQAKQFADSQKDLFNE